MPTRAEVVRDMGKPISYFPELAHVIGVNECIFLMQLVFWSTDNRDQDGWVYKTAKEWQEELALTERQQRTVRENLRARFIIDEHYHRLGHKTYYKINWAKFDEVLEEAAQQTKLRIKQKLEHPKGGLVKSAVRERTQEEAPAEMTEAPAEMTEAPDKSAVRIHRVSESIRELIPLPFSDEKGVSSFSVSPEPGKDVESSPGEMPKVEPGKVAASPPAEATLNGHTVIPESRSPDFPKKNGHPDWVKAVETYDLEAAREFCSILPRAELTPLNTERLARMYVKRRHNQLRAKDIWILKNYLFQAPLESEVKPAWACAKTFDQLLAPACLTAAIAAARGEAVEQLKECKAALDHKSGREGLEGQMAGIQNDYLAGRDIAYYPVARIFVTCRLGFEFEHLRMTRDEILDDLVYNPFWLQIMAEQGIDPEKLTGIPLQEINDEIEKFWAPRKAEKANIEKHL